MPIEIEPPRIHTRESPQEVLASDFKTNGELPIRGGWGYTREDAVIIDKHHPTVAKGIPFDGVGIEYVFVEERLYEELIIFRKPGDQYSGIRWKLDRQQICLHDGRHYDTLWFNVTALPTRDWNELKAEWEGLAGYGSPGFDVEAHERKRESRSVHFLAEYWFDISSFFGKKA